MCITHSVKMNKSQRKIEVNKKSDEFNNPIPPNKLRDMKSIPNLPNALIRNVLLEKQHNFSAEYTARKILNSVTINFGLEAEDFFNYVWDRFGFVVYRAMLRIVREQIPSDILARVLNNSIWRFVKLQEKINLMQVRILYIPSNSL